MKKRNQLVTGFLRALALVFVLFSGPQLIGQIEGETDLDIPVTTTVSTCAGQAATVTASQGGNDVSYYRWYTNELGGSSIHTGANLTRTVSTTTTFWVESVSALGNVGPARAPASILVNALSNATVHSSSTLVVCVNGTAQINVYGGTSYRWYSSATATSIIPGSPTGTGSSTYSPVVSAASTDFYVAALNAEGCEEPAASRTKVTVTTAPGVAKPLIELASGSCVGQNVFAVRLTNKESHVSYKIFKDGSDQELAITPRSEGGDLIWDVNSTGTYHVEGTSTGACQDWDESSPLSVQHFTVPGAPLLNNGVTTTLEGCTGTTIPLAVTGGSSYRWVNANTGDDVENGSGQLITGNQIDVTLSSGTTTY
ncbi:MAG: hypothetical protein HEP71_08170, partial [Roseivirga sp.]|nr:hypothetical protein [Roseivirga sp.]